MPDKQIATDQPTELNRRVLGKNGASNRRQTTAEAATKREEIEAAEQRGYERGVTAAALNAPVSRTWKGYWQRSAA